MTDEFTLGAGAGYGEFAVPDDAPTNAAAHNGAGHNGAALDNAAHPDADTYDTGDERDGALTDDEYDDLDRERSTSVALFEGDEGTLDIMQRRALLALVKNRFITAGSHPKEWRALTTNPRLLRARLNDLFLDLHLDTDRGVAFKRQAAPEGGGRFPTLLHDTSWSREETILLVYLRARGRADEAAGMTRTFVDRDNMLDHIASLRPAHATDQAKDRTRASNAIDSLLRAGLLVGASTADRFQVSPAIDVILPLEKLTAVLDWLEADSAGGTEPAESDTLPDNMIAFDESDH